MTLNNFKLIYRHPIADVMQVKGLKGCQRIHQPCRIALYAQGHDMTSINDGDILRRHPASLCSYPEQQMAHHQRRYNAFRHIHTPQKYL